MRPHLFGRGHRRGGPFGRGQGFRGRWGLAGGGWRAARMLSSDDLQLIVLSLLEEKPRHGYEIIKALEDHSSGVYKPSPGVIYPALTYLEDTGFTESETQGNKKQYKITSAGQEHLAKSRPAVVEMLRQLSLFGQKVARVQNDLADDEMEISSDSATPDKREWRKIKMEFQDVKEELKSALREKFASSMEEKKRVLEILRHAIAEIRGK